MLAGGEAGTDYRPAAPASLDAFFEKVPGGLMLKARASVTVLGSCKRCLAETRLNVPLDFTLSLVRAPSLSREREEASSEPGGPNREGEGSAASFDVRSVEEEQYDGKQVNLGGILREQLLLALPMDVLCREECQGLCSVCGANLNEARCGCERKPPDPRWEKLKGIKL
jgi:uncharacterized protein